MWIGRILLWAAMLVALVAAFKYWQVEKSAGFEVRGAGLKDLSLRRARLWFLLTGGLIFATMVYLWWLIMTERYEVAYVHDYTDRSLEPLYRFAAFGEGKQALGFCGLSSLSFGAFWSGDSLSHTNRQPLQS